MVKTAWTGLIPALTSGKIDMIIAGMSPTAERRQEIDFSDRYYRSEPVMVVSSDGDYAKAKSVKDFKDAKITGQQGVYLYNLIDQIPNVNKQTAMGTSVRCGKPLHLVSSMVMSQSDQKHALLKKLAQNIR